MDELTLLREELCHLNTLENNWKQTECRLREHQRRMRTLINGIPDFIAFKDGEGRFLEVNDPCLMVFGIQTEQMIVGKTDKELAELLPYYHDAFLTCMETDELCWKAGKLTTFEENIPSLDGNQRIFDVTKVPIFQADGSRNGIIIIGRDITERKKTERMLQESEERLRKVLVNMPVMMDVIDEHNQIIVWNRECEEVTGYTAEEVICNPHIWEILYPNGNYRTAMANHYLTLSGVYRNLECNLTCKDGSVKTISWFSIAGQFPIPGWKTWAFGVDVTKRKQIENALQEREQEYRTLLDNTPDIISRFDKELKHIYVNPAIQTVTGLPSEYFIGKTCEEVNLGEDYIFWPNKIKTVFETKQSLTLTYRLGKQYFQSQLVPELNNHSEVDYVLRITRDVTESKQMEQELARLDRLNLVGEMAAAIGHEVRNPLTTVRGFLQMLMLKKECAGFKGQFNLMIEELDRANSIISEFLALAKNKVIKLQKQNLANVITSLFPLLNANALVSSHTIKLELEPAPDVLIDEKEIRQLILNLVRNGFDAMPDGGVLTIRIYNQNENVILSVQDTGSGIDQSIIEKIGTPFLTTKENGTGLGLAVCYSIAARHNATLNFSSHSNGTTFRLCFPRE